jgi:hypothetical protein
VFFLFARSANKKTHELSKKGFMKMKAITGLKFMVFMALFTALTACQAFSAAATQAAPLPLTGANASVVGASALVLLMNPNGGNMLVPVSAQKGQPATGFAPVDFGRNRAYAFSPDRTVLAFVSAGIAGCEGECLHMLNLRTWQEILNPMALSQDIGMTWTLLTFNSDASKLAVAFNDDVKLASTVMLVGLAQGKVVQQAALEQPVFQMGFTPQGALALYGDAALKQGSGFGMRVLLLDGTSLQTQWQQDLDMVQYTTENAQSLIDPTQGKFLSPAVVFSPDNSLLYAVPADKDQLVTVDFSQRTVHSLTIQPKASLLERLLTSGAGVVYAKALNGAYKSGQLSPDGSTLFLSGQTSEAVKDSSGNWTSKNTPLGLQVVNTQDGAERAKLPNDAAEFNLSLDGKSLFLIHWTQPDMGYPQAASEVLDTGSLKVLQSLPGEIQPTRLLDGGQAWLSSNQQHDGTYQLSIYTPGAQNPRSQWSEPVNVFESWIPIP